MTRDDVIRMARDAGFFFHDAGHAPILHTNPLGYSEKCFERFAHFVIADFLRRTGQYVTNDASREAVLEQAKAEEREACAKVCESRQTPGTGSVAILQGAADAIRARGQK